MWPLQLTIALLIFTFLDMQSQSCELDKMGNGCRIISATCSCGYGCKAEYRYNSMESCKLALRGGLPNACQIKDRCLHGGSCLQITNFPGFKCTCHNTGYFGIRCEKPCPGPMNPHYKGVFPMECIVI